jgi:hypothetical protein
VADFNQIEAGALELAAQDRRIGGREAEVDCIAAVPQRRFEDLQ